MSNYSKLYWLTRLDGFQSFFIFLIVVSILVLLVYFISYISSFDDGEEISTNYGKHKRTAIWVGLVSAVILIFIPSRSEVVFIIAGGKTMDFVQQDTSINKIPAQTTKIITDFLQKQIDEVKK